MHEFLNKILSQLLSGDLSCLSSDNIIKVSEDAIDLLNKTTLDEYDQMCANLIITISQIVYNNTDRSVLFLDDGIYDLLLEKYREYNKQFQVGSPVVKFNQDEEVISEKEFIEPMTFIENPETFRQESLF